jgi:aminoglycoside phosphotransferase (APT) family kinase protein
MTPADDPASSVQEGLERLIRARQPRAEGLEIRELRRTTGGLSRENWPFDASWSEVGQRREHRLILRRDPLGSVLETDRRVEFAVLEALAKSDLPVPRVFWLDADGAFLGRPSLVMQRHGGANDHFVIEGGTSQLPLAERIGLARRYCETLARLHRFDWRAAGLGDVLDSPGADAARAAVAEWGAYLDRQLLEPAPELLEIRCWLEENCPRAQATVLVHGDWKPGNSLIRGAELEVMLDWETAHLGDPLEDVGWVTNPLRRREHLIPGHWERVDLVAHYERASGFRVDPRALRFWNVLACFKLNAILRTGVRSFAEGRSERPWSDDGALARLMFDLVEE